MAQQQYAVDEFGDQRYSSFLLAYLADGKRALRIKTNYGTDSLALTVNNLKLLEITETNDTILPGSTNKRVVFRFNKGETLSQITFDFKNRPDGSSSEILFELLVKNSVSLIRKITILSEIQVMRELSEALIAEAKRQDAMRKGKNLSAMRQTLGNLRPAPNTPANWYYGREESPIPELLTAEHGPLANLATTITGKKGTPAQQAAQLREESTRLRGTQGVARRRKTRRRKN